MKILEYLLKLLDCHGHKAGGVMEMSEYLASNRRLLDEQYRHEVAAKGAAEAIRVRSLAGHAKAVKGVRVKDE